MTKALYVCEYSLTSLNEFIESGVQVDVIFHSGLREPDLKYFKRIKKVKLDIDLLDVKKPWETKLGKIKSSNHYADIDEFIVLLGTDNFYFEFIDKYLPDVRFFYPIVEYFTNSGVENFRFFGQGVNKSFSSSFTLSEFKNTRQDDSCVVLANGPSLNDIDIKKANQYPLMGSNRVYLADKNLKIKFWVIEDRLQIEKYYEDFQKNVPIGWKKFLPFEYSILVDFENVCWLNHVYKVPQFPNVSHKPNVTYMGGTVTFLILQLAIIAGYSKIFLAGADHNFKFNNPNKFDLGLSKWHYKFRALINRNKLLRLAFEISSAVVRIFYSSKKTSSNEKRIWTSNDMSAATHFAKSYTENVVFLTPKPERAEVAFDFLEKYSKRGGVSIINVSKESHLKSFQFGEIDE